MKGKKVIIVILLIIVSMVVTISTYKNFEGTKVEEIEEKTSKDNKLTFHVQQDSGSYTEYTSGNFPSGKYYVNQVKTTCLDVYGNKITPSLVYDNGSVTIKGGKTAYCEIYLDKELYTANFHFGSAKNSTVTSTSVSWTATWTLPNATQYCFTPTTLSSCYWFSLPSSATTSHSGSMSLSPGANTFHFYVRNAAGQMASDSDTVTVTSSTPTCSFSMTSTGSITFTKSSNATKWYVGNSDIDSSKDSNYQNPTNTSYPPSTTYGYVKNDAGIGSCKITVSIQAPGCTQSSSGGGQSCYSQTCPCPNSGQAGQGCGAGSYVSSCPSNSGVSQCSSTHDTFYNDCTCTTYPGTTTYVCSVDNKSYSSSTECDSNCIATSCPTGYTAANSGKKPLYCYKLD